MRSKLRARPVDPMALAFTPHNLLGHFPLLDRAVAEESRMIERASPWSLVLSFAGRGRRPPGPPTAA